MGIIQLDPVTIGPSGETEEDRQRREAREAAQAAAARVAQQPIPLPDQATLPQQADLIGAPAAMRAQAANAQQIGDQYRAQIPAAQRDTTAAARAAEANPDDATPPSQATRTVDFGQPITFGAPSAPGPLTTTQPRPPAGPPPAGALPAVTPSTVAAQSSGAPPALGQAQQAPQPPQDTTTPGTRGETLPTARERTMALLRDRKMKQGGQPVPPPQAAPAAPVHDYTGADWADALRMPFSILGNALSAASGGQQVPFHSAREEAARRFAQEDQAAAQRTQQQMTQQRDAAQLGLQQQRLGLEQQQLEGQNVRAGIMQLVQQRQEARAQQQADMQLAMSRAQISHLESETSRNEALTDPSSQASRTAQRAVRVALSGYPQAAQQRLAAQMGDIDQLDVQSARDLIRGMPSMFRNLTARGHGGGGGGGGSTEDQAAALRQQLQEAGVPLAAVDLSTRRGRERAQAELLQRTRRGGANGTDEGTDILPGVHSPMRLSQAEPAQIRSGIAEAASSAANIRGLGDVNRRYGGLDAAISRDAQAEITPRLTIASGMVAHLGSMGVINPGEVPRINAALPNPSDLQQMTFGTFNRRMQTWQSLLEGSVRAQLAARGVDDAGINRVLATIRTGSWSQGGGRSAQPSSGGASGYQIRRADGRIIPIPAGSNMEAIRARAAANHDTVEEAR